jgi:cystathionine beta-synthase
VVGIDPFGSILAQPENLNDTDVTTYKVEGIGYDFIPDSLHRENVDSWYKTSDAPSFEMARRLIAEEGLLCGGSCGSTVYGAINWLKENGLDKKKDLRVVCVLSDGIRNYLSKFAADEWMVANGFLESDILLQKDHPLFGKTIADLNIAAIPHYDDRFTINDALDALDAGQVAIPIIECGKIKGIVTRDSVLKSVVKKSLGNQNSASKAMTKDIAIVDYSTDLTAIDSLLKQHEIVFVQKKDSEDKVVALYGVSKLDLIKLYRKMTKELL